MRLDVAFRPGVQRELNCAGGGGDVTELNFSVFCVSLSDFRQDQFLRGLRNITGEPLVIISNTLDVMPILIEIERGANSLCFGLALRNGIQQSQRRSARKRVIAWRASSGVDATKSDKIILICVSAGARKEEARQPGAVPGFRGSPSRTDLGLSRFRQRHDVP